jgi:hypothetical protein
MGLEAECTVRYGGKASRGQARFEEKEITFRGDFRLVIPLAEVKSAEAKGGTLAIRSGAGTAHFELGAAAEKWAGKIRSPKGRLDKLGVKAGSRVLLAGLGGDDDGSAFRRELEGRGAQVQARGSGMDLVFVRMAKVGDLARLASLRKAILPAGAIWVLWPKGRKELREDDVRAVAIAGGLVDVKVVSFSETLSGLKLVIPLKLR